MRVVFLQRHHAGAKQLDSGATIHGALEGLQLVDLSFGLPVAPRFRRTASMSRRMVLANCCIA